VKKTYKRNPTELRALSTYIKLMRASESVTARIHRNLSAIGLTISQLGVLDALYHLGPLSQTEIGKKILKSSGNITMVIDNLEKRGLVRRERRKSDRRYIIVRLTDEGHGLISDIFPPHAAVIAEEMSSLTAAEQAQLGHLCRKLGLKEGR
jgi:MarR family 2-MHQ and catechol resistance regulon transcriptional repressor